MYVYRNNVDELIFVLKCIVSEQILGSCKLLGTFQLRLEFLL